MSLARLGPPLLLLGAVCSGFCLSSAQAAEPPRTAYRPTAQADLPALTRLILHRSPSLQAAQLEVELARAEVQQSRLYENPVADLSWGTIPVGQTNPAGLESPYANIPNYGVGLSYRFLIGKRGARQQRATAVAAGSRSMRDAMAKSQALEFVRLLGDLALATMRAEGAKGLLDDARHSLGLAQSRLNASFGTPLDVDRLQIEVSRVEQWILRSEGEMSGALAGCAATLGMSCEGFGGRDEAKAFLVGWVDRALAVKAESLEERADIRALRSYEEAARAELRLAKAQAIPDPTVRIGFVHDRFVVSGNQQNSLNLTLWVPLPLLDHGQAQAQGAAARQTRLAAQREKLLEAARARLPLLRKTLEIQRQRGQLLVSEMLPRARAVLEDLERAAANRLVALTDVIQARRTVHELLGEEADSLGNAFAAALELLAQLPTSGEGAGEPPAGAGP